MVKPGEGEFRYPHETVVELVVVPDDGYRFASWRGDTGTIANVDHASTSITAEGDYAIAARFQRIGAVDYPLVVGLIGGVAAAAVVIYIVARRRAG